MYNLDSDTELVDFDSAWFEADTFEKYLIEITGDTSISIGIDRIDASNYQVWLDCRSEKTKYFNSFEALESYMRQTYTDVEWQ